VGTVTGGHRGDLFWLADPGQVVKYPVSCYCREVPQRDAEATRQRLITAARAEFAEHGIAGARWDRIAAAANANKAQIYHYFGNKDRLFDAVWEAVVRQIIEATPMDVEDLAGFAARISDTYADHQDTLRLITWQRLERGEDPPNAYAVEDFNSRINAISKAQADGLISSRFEAPVLFSLIVHTAALWGMSSPDILSVANLTDAYERRDIVRSAVAALLTD
jgi:AcrR family transcriptional regulator